MLCWDIFCARFHYQFFKLSKYPQGCIIKKMRIGGYIDKPGF